MLMPGGADMQRIHRACLLSYRQRLAYVAMLTHLRLGTHWNVSFSPEVVSGEILTLRGTSSPIGYPVGRCRFHDEHATEIVQEAAPSPGHCCRP